MKAQCDEHGCKELLCGCPVDVLESSKQISEICRAKDKWIDKLLTAAEYASDVLDDDFATDEERANAVKALKKASDYEC